MSDNSMHHVQGGGPAKGADMTGTKSWETPNALVVVLSLLLSVVSVLLLLALVRVSTRRRLHQTRSLS